MGAVPPGIAGHARGFRGDPALVWGWYQWRRALVGRAAPNRAHHAPGSAERRVPAFTLVTQNVDGLHAAAGSQSVIALHGALMLDRGSGCGRRRRRWYTRSSRTRRWSGSSRPAAGPAAGADVLLVVGTSGVVYPAASLAPHAQRAGARVIVINTERAEGDVALQLTGPAGVLLPALVDAAFG